MSLAALRRLQPTIQVPAGLDAPRRARAWLRSILAGIVPLETLDDLELIASELVTNSVLHAGLPPAASIELQVAVSAEAVVLTVRDAGCGFRLDPPAPPNPSAPGGRGLRIVRLLSERVVVDPSQGQVMVEVRR